MTIHFFNLLAVPTGRDSESEFFRLWRDVNAHLAAKPGYVEHQLHRATGTSTPFTYINHGVWTSVQNYRAAQDDQFRSMLAQPAWSAFPSTSSLYETVHQGHGMRPPVPTAQGPVSPAGPPA